MSKGNYFDGLFDCMFYQPEEPTPSREISELCECIKIVAFNLSHGLYDRAEQKSLMVQHLTRIAELRAITCSKYSEH